MTRLGKMLTAAAAGAVLALSAGPAGAVLIVNGGFSLGTSPPSNGGFRFLSAGATNITGWTISSGSIDWIRGYWESADGDGYSIDLVGSGGSPFGTLSQTITTTPGATYLLTFDLSSNPDVNLDPRTLNVTAGATTSAFSYNAAHTRADMNWMSRSLEFTAAGASTLISFQSTNGLCCYGAALDNVAVSLVSAPGAIPEPSTWAFAILGFGAAGAMLRRRRLVPA